MLAPIRHKIVSAILLLAGLLGLPMMASATMISYSLNIAEDAKVAANPNDMMAQMMAAWRTQQELLAGRDMPYMHLVNTSTEASGLITSFKLTLNQPNMHNFDTVLITDLSPGITYNIITPADGQMGLRSDEILINFTGFSPGKFVQFKTDIDCDAGNVNMFSDYRTVLTNLTGPYGGGAPGLPPKSVVDVQFSSVFNYQIPPTPIPDFIALKPTQTGIGFRSAYSMDSVAPLVMGGFVPEPSTWVMYGLLAMASVLGWGRSRRVENA
ncbi:MAG: hypothetical protein SFX18_03180 [Pirellulales bacterium]|nr:hypothetical protein [Pirellulales bacterium]